jgi:Xaa-Pro aminopeptidase
MIFCAYFFRWPRTVNQPIICLLYFMKEGRRCATKCPIIAWLFFFETQFVTVLMMWIYVYHQDPDFYYLTGYKEPNLVLVVFSNNQTNKEGSHTTK